MTLRMRPARQPLHYVPCDTVAARVAREQGVRPGTVEQWMRGRRPVQLMCAAIVRVMVALGQRQRVGRFLAPIEAAEAGLTAPRLTPALELEAQQADVAEDLREKAFNLRPSRETALPFLRAIDTERAQQLALRQALVTEYELQ